MGKTELTALSVSSRIHDLLSTVPTYLNFSTFQKDLWLSLCSGFVLHSGDEDINIHLLVGNYLLRCLTGLPIFLCRIYSKYRQSSLLRIITFLGKVSKAKFRNARATLPSDQIQIDIFTA
jgi:hypothetical protein